MNWYIGQEIVAIKNHVDGEFKIGDTFIVRGLRSSVCKCKSIDIDISKSPHPKYKRGVARCSKCNTVFNDSDEIYWFSQYSFAPLDELMAEQIEELKLELSL